MIIFFYGEDDFRAKKKIRELKERFIREVDKGGVNIAVIEGKTATLKEINEKLAPASLLSSKRMVVIEDIFLNRQKEILGEILEYLKSFEEKKNDNIVIFLENSLKTKRKGAGQEVLKINSEGRESPLNKKEKELFDFLSGRKFSQEFKKLSNTDVAEWIKKEADGRGAHFSAEAATALAGLCAGDLWQIDNEIEKLIHYKGGRQEKLAATGEKTKVEALDVKETVKGKFEENIFSLTDALSAKNKALAAKLLNDQYESGASESYVLSMIVRQIKILLSARLALDAGISPAALAKELKLHPFVAQKAASQARNFKSGQLKNILDGLVRSDFKMKIGASDLWTELDLLIAKI